MKHASIRGVVAGVVVAALAVTGALAGAGPAQAASPGKNTLDRAVTAVRTVPWKPVTPVAAAPGTGRPAVLPAPRWPAAGTAAVTLGAKARPGEVVSLAAPASGAAAAGVSGRAVGSGKATVAVLGPAVAKRLGGIGLAFTVTSGGATAAPVSVRADVSGFANSFGGDLASHLTLRQLPACALTTPARAGCSTSKPVASHVDLRTGTLVAEQPVTAAAAGQAPPVFIAAADPGGESGSFSATSLGVSSSWSVGKQSGDFSWSYPIPEVPAVAGETPNLQLAYSAGSVDGLVSSQNTQPTWAGLGWNLSVPFIERSYQSCTQQDTTLEDRCWAGDVLTLSLSGSTARLVRDRAAGADVWRSRDDAGWTIRRLHVPAGDPGNGDDDGEYWEVTTTNGTVYTFGRGRDRVSGAATDSVFTEPVFGLKAGDPCHAATQAASWCQQAYKWNLDSVVDAHGNEQQYAYDQEINDYQRAGTTPTRYVRDGHLTTVTYGRRVGTDAAATSRLVLDAQLRCTAAADGAGTCPSLSDANSTAYPDVPTYLLCASDATSCTQRSPSFFSGVLLHSVTAQRRAGTGWADVDRVDLSYSFPDPTDGTSASLWLERIRRTGLSGNGTARLPDLTFTGQELPNRIDADPAGGVPLMRKLRISTVEDELGRQVQVTYGQPDPCGPGNFPEGRADTNTQDCFPALRQNGRSEPGFGWYYKYLATQTRVVDTTGGSPDQVTRYDYRGAPAWHHDDDPLAPANGLSWGDWRGYGEVDADQMSPTRPLSVTRSRFYRGMDGDDLAGGGHKTVAVTDSQGGSVPDLAWLNGKVREEQQFHLDAAGNPDYELGGTITTYDSARTTPAETGQSDAQHDAHLVVVTRTAGRQTVVPEGTGPRSSRTTRVDTTYDQYGQTLTTTAVGGGLTRCARNSFARDDATVAAGMLSFAYRVRSYEGTCTDPTRLVSGGDTYYDGSTTIGGPVRRGDATRTVSVVTASGTSDITSTVSSSATFDAYGRPRSATDGRGLVTRTDYTPATGAPTSRSVTNALGQVTSSALDPDRGQPTAVTDVNGRTTRTGYDALGRTTSVRLPDQAADAPAAWTYSYALDLDRRAAPLVTTRQLQSGSTYLITYQFSDSLARPRQTQRISPSSTADSPATIVSDSRYDERGLVAATTVPSVAAGRAGSALIAVSPAASDETRTTYDAVGRSLSASLYTRGTFKWATTTAYFGDHARTTPPAGGVAKTTWTDVWNRTVRADDGVGARLVTRTFGYDAGDRLTSSTDPAGHVTRTSYDLLGRAATTDDPDAGASAIRYDADGNVIGVTDARGKVVSSEYDALNRPTTTWDGPVSSGTLIHRSTYDSADITNGLGRLAQDTTFDGRSAYTRAVTGYDARGRATGASWSFPAGVGLSLLPATYSTSYTYDSADHQTAVRYNNTLVGLDQETVTTGYDDLGYARTLQTSSTGLLGTTTTDLVKATDYAADGSVIRRDYADALHPVTRQYSYEPGTHRLANVSTLVGNPLTADPAVKQDDDYTWDPSGNLSRVTDNTSVDLLHSDPVNTCYSYDGLDRVTHAWTSRTPDCTDAADTVVHDGAAGMNKAWTYSPDGNITSARSLLITNTYAYGDPAHPHAVTKQGLNTYQYGADGAMTSRLQGIVPSLLAYNAEGRLSQVTTGLKNTRFVYAPDGTRLARLNADTTATLYIDGEEINVAAGVATGTRYYDQDGVTIATRNKLGTTWQLSDDTGSAQISVPKGTELVSRTYYDPYGQIRGGLGASNPSTDHGFLNSVKDPLTGLNALGARYYDADLGRFVSTDPADNQSSAQAANAYAYGNNNPLLYSDANGLWGIPKFVKSAAGAVAGAASSTANWVGDHKAQIAGVAVGIGVGLAIGASCATVIGCVAVGAAVGVAAGVAGGATEYTVDVATSDKTFSWSGLLKASVVGGVWGGLTGGVLGGLGKFLEPWIAPWLAPLKGTLDRITKPLKTGLQRLARATRGGKGGAEDGAALPAEDPGAATTGGGSTSGPADAGPTTTAPKPPKVDPPDPAKPVIVDTNAVYNRPGVAGQLDEGETPVITQTVSAELKNNAASGRMHMPRNAGDLEVIPDVMDVNLRIQIRGALAALKPNQRGLFGDGSIGATAVHTGFPIITSDKNFTTVLRGLGVEVRKP